MAAPDPVDYPVCMMWQVTKSTPFAINDEGVSTFHQMVDLDYLSKQLANDRVSGDRDPDDHRVIHFSHIQAREIAKALLKAADEVDPPQAGPS